MAVADAADGRLDAGFSPALGVADRHVLHAAIAVMDHASSLSLRRACSACSSASSTKPVRAELETFQPAMRRARR